MTGNCKVSPPGVNAAESQGKKFFSAF